MLGAAEEKGDAAPDAGGAEEAREARESSGDQTIQFTGLGAVGLATMDGGTRGGQQVRRQRCRRRTARPPG